MDTHRPVRVTVPFTHSQLWDATNPDDSTKSTHLWMVYRALETLQAAKAADQRVKDLTRLIRPAANEPRVFADRFRKGLWDADAIEPYNDTIWDGMAEAALGMPSVATYASHFYDPDTRENWLGQTDPTALTQGARFYWKAIDEISWGMQFEAGYSFGLAAHYFTDLTQPMHAANFTNVHWPLLAHRDYERFAIDYMNTNPPPAQSFQAGTDVLPENYLIATARASKLLYAKLLKDSWQTSITAALSAGIQATAQFLWLWASQSLASARWGDPTDLGLPFVAGDGRVQPAVLRPHADGSSTWEIRQSIHNGTLQQVRLPIDTKRPDLRILQGDFRAAGGARVAVVHAASGSWQFFTAEGKETAEVKTSAGVPFQGDLLQSGHDQVGMYIDGKWLVHTSQGTRELSLGGAGELPLPACYFGKTSGDVPATWNPTTGVWKTARGPEILELRWGQEGDVPLPGAYHGDGVAVPAVYRPITRTWHVSTGFLKDHAVLTIPFGDLGVVPVPGDYFGTGRTHPAFYRPRDGRWVVTPDLSTAM